MADAPVVHIGENSAEHVALKLMERIAGIEKRSITGSDPSELKAGWQKADRKWMLDTYAECLSAIRDPQTRK